MFKDLVKLQERTVTGFGKMNYIAVPNVIKDKMPPGTVVKWSQIPGHDAYVIEICEARKRQNEFNSRRA